MRVAREIFSDGKFNWGRVVALFYFACRLVIKVSVISGSILFSSPFSLNHSLALLSSVRQRKQGSSQSEQIHCFVNCSAQNGTAIYTFWGELASSLCNKTASSFSPQALLTKVPDIIRTIISWATDYLRDHVINWIRDQGGWVRNQQMCFPHIDLQVSCFFTNVFLKLW